ncbi:MAG: sulfite exporter TauE/SafE family protein [Sphingomicrobium sp.]
MEHLFQLPPHLVALLCLGASAGFFAGLIGIGGGFILVPGLQMVFSMQPELAGKVMPVVLGTTTCCMIFTATASARAQQARAAVNVEAFKRLGLSMGGGAAIGAILATVISTVAVKWAFGLFCLYSAAGFLFFRPTPGRDGWAVATGNAALPGTFFGAICGLIGVGGTNLVVPYLMQRNVELRTAVGTASALQIPAALIGTAAYFLLGGGGLNAFGDVGYVRMPVVGVLAAAALLFAPLGVRAGHWLPVPALRKVFGAFTGLVGLKMLGLLPL